MIFLRLILRTITHRKEAVEEIITGAKPLTGYLFGVIAISTSLLVELIARINSGLGVRYGLLVQVPLVFVKAIILLCIYGVMVFFLTKLLGAKGELRVFMPLWGWTLIPSFFMSLTLIPYAAISKWMALAHGLPTFFIFCGLLAIFEFVWEVLLATEMIAQSMELKTSRALLVYCVAFIFYAILNSTLF